MPDLYLVRHGQTEWSELGKHTGRTDLALTPAGERDAAALRPLLAGHAFAQVLVSPLQRARRTAEAAGLTPYETDDDLVEWDYGALDGRTTAEISTERGRPWRIWDDGAEEYGGEPIDLVAKRAQRVLDRVAGTDGDVALVGHGHSLRVLAATYLGLEPQAGALLTLAAGSVSVLGREHDRAVIVRWNSRPSDCGG